MIQPIMAAVFLLASAQAGEIKVDVGRANWKSLPQLKAVDRPLPNSAMVGHVEKLLADGECRIRGQSASRFDITVPYAVQVQPDGKAQWVIVAETGCPALESFVGLIVLERAKLGEFLATGERNARWYASELNFNLQ